MNTYSIDPAHFQDAYTRRLEQYVESLSEEWQVVLQPTLSLTWRVFTCRSILNVTQGWKIHISAAACEAVELCDRVLPILIKAQTAFKIPETVQDIVNINSGLIGPTQYGKIVTVYPHSNEQCRLLVNALRKVWPHSKGPRVPTDIVPAKGSAISLRYGTFFSNHAVTDSCGRVLPALTRPDGSLVEDIRTIDGAQPEWAPEPPLACFSFYKSKRRNSIQVEGRRFLFLVHLYHSPKSDLYLAMDRVTAETVVIKTAHRGRYGDLNGYDAVDRLRNEYAVLKALEEVPGLSPIPIGFCERGKEAFLVVEDLAGESLAEMPVADQRRFLGRMVELVARLHHSGYVHRDLKLGNFMWAEDSLRLIDFELTTQKGADVKILGGSEGYAAPESQSGYAEEASDVYSVGACIATIALGRNLSELPKGAGRLIGMMHLLGDHEAASLTQSLTRRVPEQRLLLNESRDAIERYAYAPEVIEKKLPQHTKALSGSLLRWIHRAAYESAMNTRTFQKCIQPGIVCWRNRSQSPDLECEGINDGAAGILIGLASLQYALRRCDFTEDLRSGAKWLQTRSPFVGANGLFTGNAGVSLALALTGRAIGTDEFTPASEARFFESLHAPDKKEYDLFSGAAGVLWASMLLTAITGSKSYEESANTMAARLMEAVEEEDGIPIWRPSGVLSSPNDPYTGTAHGSTGVAMALGKWGIVSGSAECIQLAKSVFVSVYDRCRTDDHTALYPFTHRKRKPMPIGGWCHGIGGYIWAILSAFGDDEDLREQIDWAVGRLSQASLVDNATYCHGLAGLLEVWRMIGSIPRHASLAAERMNRIVNMLRSLSQRDQKGILWCSENPAYVTPDLWIGFLAPATALALYASQTPDALLSAAWLKRVAGRG